MLFIRCSFKIKTCVRIYVLFRFVFLLHVYLCNLSVFCLYAVRLRLKHVLEFMCCSVLSSYFMSTFVTCPYVVYTLFFRIETCVRTYVLFRFVFLLHELYPSPWVVVARYENQACPLGLLEVVCFHPYSDWVSPPSCTVCKQKVW